MHFRCSLVGFVLLVFIGSIFVVLCLCFHVNFIFLGLLFLRLRAF